MASKPALISILLLGHFSRKRWRVEDLEKYQP
jgi:hypothetical protein